MKTRIIHTKIHEDDYFRPLNDREQNFFLFLLTNERVNLTGMYYCPDWYILGCKPNWNQKSLDQMKEKFAGDKKFGFINGWVKIINYCKYNNYSGELNQKAIEKEKMDIPTEVIEYSIDTPSIGYAKSIDTLNNHKSIINNKKSVLLSEEEKVELIEYLTTKGINRDLATSELNKFISYWTEKNHAGTKERWQLEKTFEVQKRLTTWFNNIKKFGGNNGKPVVG